MVSLCAFRSRPIQAVQASFCAALLGVGASAFAGEPRSPTGQSEGTSSSRAFASEVRRAIQRECGHPDRLSVLIRSVTAAETLFAHHPDQKRIPASNVKLITSAAAMVYLGPDYTFPTDVYAAGPIQEGVLKGDIYLKGYGDSSLVQERMRELANGVRLSGIRRISGDLVADDSFFDEERYGRGWNVGGSLRPYLAPHGALSVNFSVVTVYVEPGPEAGSPARVQLDPPSDTVRLEARVKTGPRQGRIQIHLGRRQKNGVDWITVDGSIPVDQERARYSAAVSDPARYAAGVFSAFLRQEGIRLEGRIRRGVTPPEAELVARQLSPPLGEIIRGLNKFSNNFIAEQVLKTLGAEVHGLPGTAEKGLLVMRDFLVSLGVPASSFDLADGSGLSRLNQMTARGLVTLLENVYNDFRLRPEFTASLAVLGVDGTVRKRMPASHAARRVRVKTGMLGGVHTLSGFAAAENGEILAFSILSNGDACRPRGVMHGIARAMTSLDRPLPEGLKQGLEGARTTLSRPMPRPAQRDQWRAGGRARNGPVVPMSEAMRMGEGIVPFHEAEETPPEGPGREGK